LSGDSGENYAGDTIVICTGASARWLGIPSEEKLKGFGVSACATCDGFFFRGERVAVVGGGNTAAEEAIFLTNFATKVTVIHRRDELRAEKILQDRMFRNPKIEMAWSSVVDEILGTDDPPGVAGVRIRNVKTSAARVVDVKGVFIAIGHTPNTELFRGQLHMDAEGYIVTAPDSTATSISGVYAAGDVQDRIYRQAVTAAGTGCMAALEAEKFLAEQETVTVAAQ
jgi:thioredoxin reductase (NADPH)